MKVFFIAIDFAFVCNPKATVSGTVKPALCRKIGSQMRSTTSLAILTILYVDTTRSGLSRDVSILKTTMIVRITHTANGMIRQVKYRLSDEVSRMFCTEEYTTSLFGYVYLALENSDLQDSLKESVNECGNQDTAVECRNVVIPNFDIGRGNGGNPDSKKKSSRVDSRREEERNKDEEEKDDEKRFVG